MTRDRANPCVDPRLASPYCGAEHCHEPSAATHATSSPSVGAARVVVPPLDPALFLDFQKGAARSVERAMFSLLSAGATCEVWGEGDLLAMLINGETLYAKPFDGRLELHLGGDNRMIVGVKKRSRDVANALLYWLPSVRVPREKAREESERAKREALEADRRAQRQRAMEAKAARRATLLSEAIERKAEVAATSADFNGYVNNVGRLFGVRARCHAEEPSLYEGGYAEDRPGSRYPWEPKTATIEFDSLKLDELRVMVEALMAHRAKPRSGR